MPNQTALCVKLREVGAGSCGVENVLPDWIPWTAMRQSDFIQLDSHWQKFQKVPRVLLQQVILDIQGGKSFAVESSDVNKTQQSSVMIAHDAS